MSDAPQSARVLPVLHTPRLTLRAHTPQDFASSFSMWGNEQFMRFFGGKPMLHEDVWLRLLRYAGNWSLLGYGFWLVEERATGRFVGEAGFHELQRATEPSFRGVPEIGWGLLPAFQGKGYAREAVAAAQAWGDVNIAGDQTVCIIHPDNVPSIRIAEGAGYSERARGSYKGAPIILFNRPKPNHT